MKILSLSGSLRENSYNRGVLQAAARALAGGATMKIYEQLRMIPPYDEDMDAPAPVRAFRQAIQDAGALLIATPEYNSSFPGQLKNALDWASRPFPNNALRGKPVAVVGASTGLFGAVWAQADLRKVLTRIGARVLDRELAIGQAHEAFHSDGSLKDPALAAALAGIVAQLIDEAADLQERSA
ncbi:MAG: NADPH-dependent FMN reductase [Actinomycetota bacterium]